MFFRALVVHARLKAVNDAYKLAQNPSFVVSHPREEYNQWYADNIKGQYVPENVKQARKEEDVVLEFHSFLLQFMERNPYP